jgi:hypothetical protein
LEHSSEILFAQQATLVYAWALFRVKKRGLSAVQSFEFKWIKPAD